MLPRAWLPSHLSQNNDWTSTGWASGLQRPNVAVSGHSPKPLPHTSVHSKQKKRKEAQLLASLWGRKEVHHKSNLSSFLGLIQYIGFCFSCLGAGHTLDVQGPQRTKMVVRTSVEQLTLHSLLGPWRMKRWKDYISRFYLERERIEWQLNVQNCVKVWHQSVVSWPQGKVVWPRKNSAWQGIQEIAAASLSL